MRAKLDAAENAGAAAIVHGGEADAAEKIKQVAGGPLYGAVDLVGTTETATLALAVLRKGGRLILVGLYGGEIPLSLVATIQRALMIQGSHLGYDRGIKESRRARARGKTPADTDPETAAVGSEPHTR